MPTPGEVVKIRVHTTDVMACVDVLEAAEVSVPNMSLAQVVRVALSILCESARKQGIVPRRDGFDYTSMIAPFRRASLPAKVQVGHDILLAEKLRQGEDKTIALGTLPTGQRLAQGEVASEAPPERPRLVREKSKGRIQELQLKATNDPANMTPAEFRELRELKQRAASAVRGA